MNKSILMMMMMVTLLSASVGLANVFAPMSGDAAATPAEDALYQKGAKAIDDEKWDDAITLFGRLKSGSRADAALYWMAYAQHKVGRKAEALATLQSLKQKHSSSRWNDDAKALEIEIRQSSGQGVSPDSVTDEGLKLLAITSLMHTDQERAVGLLEKILQGKSSAETKEQSLFVLSQSSSPRAQQLIERVARGESGDELQQRALQMIGTSGSARSRALLADVFQKAQDSETKGAALRGLMLAGDRQAVLNAATSERDPAVRGDAAHLLGVMHATAELDRLYATEASVEVKQEILQGMFIAGNVGRLIQLAGSEKDPVLRHSAIRLLGVSGSKQGSDALLRLWQTETDPEVKEAVIQGLFIQQNAVALVAMARKETNRALKRSIVEKLSLMSSKEARDYMRELLDQ